MKRSPVFGLAVVLVALGTIVLACEEDRPPASAGADTVNPPTSSSGGTLIDAGSDAEPDELIGPELCNDVEQISQAMGEWGHELEPNAPAGGTITRGKYALNEVRLYGAVVDQDASDPVPPGATGKVVRATIYVGQKSMRFTESSGTDPETLPADSVHASTYVTSGTNLTLTNVCPTSQGGMTIPYTATSSQLTLYMSPASLYLYRLVP